MPRRLPALVCVIALYAAVLARAPHPLAVAQDSTGTTTRISLSFDGTQGNDSSDDPALSADGRYVAFCSFASNLVAGDTNGVYDVFVHDRQTGITDRVSVSSSGAQGNGHSWVTEISADGRYVVFASLANNLVAGDTNGIQDIFVHDRQTGVTSRVSISTDGTQANQLSWEAALSADGLVVAFSSLATNLVAGDTNNTYDIFVHDRQTGVTSRVSVRSDGTQANYRSMNPALSADGRYVAFETLATNLADGNPNEEWWNIYVHDRQTNVTSLVSINRDGQKGDRNSRDSSLSSDGRFVAFDSSATNLVAEDMNGRDDIFVYDRQTGNVSLVSVSSDGTQANANSTVPFLSPDGRYVIFDSYATNLVAGDTSIMADVFIHDRQTGDTSVISVSSDGTWGNNQSYDPCISADGRYVVFGSLANNLVAGDTNGVGDIFIRERQGAAFAPSITGFDPASGPIGASVTIDGANFSRATAVAFNGTGQPSFAINPAGTQITAAVPTGATTGRISITTTDGTAESATDFTVIPAPTIAGISPAAGPVGTAVAITGANFAGTTAVTFNGTGQPGFTIDPAGTQITAAVPAGATTGKISLTTPGGTAESATDFTVIPAPTIAGFSPAAGPVGTAVVITGANFAGATAVAFNGTSQPAFSVNPEGTQITAAVPAGATTGKIAVTAPGGIATSAADFVVTPPPAIYLSSTGSGKVGPAAASKAFTNADILSYVKATNTWDILYDGSYIKTTKNVGAFAFVGDDILLGFSAAQVVPGLGTAKVPAQDLVRFTPTSTGYNNTAGTFALYFDGSDVGLTTSAEAIDALWIDAQGRLYISTTGTAKVNGPTGAAITAHDEDVLRFTPTSTGATTAGAWALYWDPTSVTGMSAEDINGYWEDPATGARYVTILGAFNVGNTAYGGKFAGNGKTILRFAPNAAAPGGWAPAEKVTWLATGAAFPSNIDGIEMGR